MVIKEDGTKWACQSCLKGHRVSGCTHKDRPLVFVPKKGRPVTQCQHCRVERKKRSAHVKCDCGEKYHTKEKCIHLRNAENGLLDSPSGELGSVPEDHELSDPQDCCCHHGEKCTCATMKKEHSGDDMHGLHHAAGHCRVSKPRLSPAHSDGHITVFANGHHKPTHRNNPLAQDVNLPHRMPRSHTDQGPQGSTRASVDGRAPERSELNGSQWQQQPNLFGTSVPEDENASMNAFTYSNVPTEGYPFDASQADQMAGSSNNYFDIAQADRMVGSAAESFNGQNMTSDGSSQSFADAAWPTAISTSDTNNFDWNSVDWTNLGNTTCSHQPALTYASSNTVSDFGENTPPEEFSALFENSAVDQNSAPSSNNAQAMPMPVSQTMTTSSNDNTASRWSLPASFWTGLGTNNSSANASSESIASHSAAFPPAQTPPTSGSEGIQPSQSNLRRNMSAQSTSRPRPKMVMQKSSTLPSTPTWEQLLQTSRTENLWDTEGLEDSISSTNTFTSGPADAMKDAISIPTSTFEEQPQAPQILSSSISNEQLYMDPESTVPFDMGDPFSDLSSFYPQWPQ